MARNIFCRGAIAQVLFRKDTSLRSLSDFRVWAFLGVASSLFILLAGSPSVCCARDLQHNECYQAQFTQRLQWATTGGWTEDGRALLVVDVFRQKVLRISRQGEVTDAFAAESNQTLGWPSQIRSVNGEYLVEADRIDQIFDFDTSLDLSNPPIRIKDRPLTDYTGHEPGHIILSELYDWAPLSGGILAFADVTVVSGSEAKKEKLESAFLYFDDSDQYVNYRTIPLRAPVLHRYLRNTVYLATLNNETGYILFFDERPRIGEVKPGSVQVRYLENFPDDFRHGPPLKTEWSSKKRQGARQATATYRVFENTRMPVALYAWSSHLYLLAKEAMKKNGETSWWLIRLEPGDGVELARARLPTQAAHLTVVPGNEHWALIEKGPVQGIGDIHAPYMDTKSMVLVPAEWLESPRHSPLARDSDVACVPLPPVKAKN